MIDTLRDKLEEISAIGTTAEAHARRQLNKASSAHELGLRVVRRTCAEMFADQGERAISIDQDMFLALGFGAHFNDAMPQLQAQRAIDAELTNRAGEPLLVVVDNTDHMHESCREINLKTGIIADYATRHELRRYEFLVGNMSYELSKSIGAVGLVNAAIKTDRHAIDYHQNPHARLSYVHEAYGSCIDPYRVHALELINTGVGHVYDPDETERGRPRRSVFVGRQAIKEGLDMLSENPVFRYEYPFPGDVASLFERMTSTQNDMLADFIARES